MREFQAQAEDTAKDLGASIWYGLPNPESGAWVLWPGTDLASYVDFARRIDARVLYVDTSLEVICVARDGVLHFFETRAGAFEEEFHPAVTWGDEADLADECLDEEGTDERALNALPPELLELAAKIANDGRYHPFRMGTTVVAELTGELDVRQQMLVGAAAEQIFFRDVFSALDAEARHHAARLLADPEFDPLTFQRKRGADQDFVTSRLPDASERLRVEVRKTLQAIAVERGLYEVARQKLALDANAILDAMGQTERDRLGFAHQKHLRADILAPYLSTYAAPRHEDLMGEVVRCERERFAVAREARYATAGRELMRLGFTRAKAAKLLGVSGDLLDRLLTAHAHDVTFEADDPLLLAITAAQTSGKTT